MALEEHQKYCEILVLAAFTLVGVPKELVIAAITVKNLRKIVTDGKDEIITQMLEYKTFDSKVL
ncbi:uncharacterized protein TrAFT101_003923 [Trichoderma asperellum]|nr:hypothetical protein TrAFT101_003923 [Trichoderma asperellum]